MYVFVRLLDVPHKTTLIWILYVDRSFYTSFFYNIFFLLTAETSTACNSREHGTPYLIFVIVRSVNYNIMLLCSCMRYCVDVMGQQWRRRAVL